VSEFFNLPILPAALGPGVYSASNINEYHAQKNVSGEMSTVRLTTIPPYVSQLSRQCGIPNISQPYRPPRPVTFVIEIYKITLLSLRPS
jgi:hypothetical protein